MPSGGSSTTTGQVLTFRTPSEAASAPGQNAVSPQKPSSTGFRPDIQGLRAVAIITVVLYHAGVPWLRGGFVGVDLFFVISGFLITSLLLRERLSTGRISLPRFWARRVRRLLPASTLVLLVTAIATILWLPRSARSAVGWDIASSALSVANWRFAWQSTDYLAQERDPSPVLHYWSLGVEEQFYLVWPILLGLLTMSVAVGGRASRHVRLRLAAVLGAIVVVSFVYGLVMTHVNQPYAFFGTPSRAWQLGLGALVAVAAPFIARADPRIRSAMGWAGAVLFVVAAALLTEAGAGPFAYPGWIALVPTLAAVALIAAGIGGDVPRLGAALGARPMRYVGDLSYSWYLWHWPVLIFAAVLVEDDPAWVRTAAVVVSFGLAVASYRFVEKPWRYPRPELRLAHVSLLVGAVLVSVSLLAAFTVVLTGKFTSPTTVVTETGESLVLRPDPAVAIDDIVSLRDAGCDLEYEAADYRRCVFEPPPRGETAGKAALPVSARIVVMGDSHASHVFPGLQAAGRAQNWAIQPLTKSACTPSDITLWTPARRRAFTECDTWRRVALKALRDDPPDLVIFSSSFQDAVTLVDRATGKHVEGPAVVDAWVDGMRRTMRTLTEAGIPVLILRDVPAAEDAVPACVEKHSDVRDCAIPERKRIVEREAAEGLDGAHYADFTPLFCSGGVCSVTVGDILVYRDRAHLTKTFSETLSGFFVTTLTPLLDSER